MYLIFDTETTGLPQDFKKSYQDLDNWSTARCVQLSWQLHNRLGELIDSGNDIIKPDGFDIPQASIKIHHNECIDCNLCVYICPIEVLEISNEK